MRKSAQSLGVKADLGAPCVQSANTGYQKKLLRVFPLPLLGHWRLGEVDTIKPIYTLHSLSQDLNWLQVT